MGTPSTPRDKSEFAYDSHVVCYLSIRLKTQKKPDSLFVIGMLYWRQQVEVDLAQGHVGPGGPNPHPVAKAEGDAGGLADQTPPVRVVFVKVVLQLGDVH